jgi:type IV pilus assembly protein PilF
MPDSLRSVRSFRWQGSRLASLALGPGLLALAAAGLWGCAQTSNPNGVGGVAATAPRTADGKEIATASDKTDLDRRADAHMELARAYFTSGQYTTSLDEVKQALAARPERADAWSMRGLVYGALGDPTTADESFRKSLELRPNDADTLHNYGWFLCQVGRYPEAAKQFDLALHVPNYAGSSRTMLAQGVCQGRSGDLAAAEKTLSTAYERDPVNPATAFALSDVLYRRAQYERARFYIRRVNSREETTNAQSLWLAIRIEHKLNNDDGVQSLGRQLHQRFPQSTESLQFDKGRLDD